MSASGDANPFESALDRLRLKQAVAVQQQAVVDEENADASESDALQSLAVAAVHSAATPVDAEEVNSDAEAAPDTDEADSDASTPRGNMAPQRPDISAQGSDEILPEIVLPPEAPLWRTRGERIERTLFGAVLRCTCTVVDEVRLTVWLLCFVAALICTAFFIADNSLHVLDVGDLKVHEHAVSISIGAAFTLVACVLSFVQIKDHRDNWVHPPSQRCVVRILLMVPVYALSAWLSLIFIRYSLYIDFVRGCYEAFVIYTFMILLTKYLGGHNGVVECMQYKPDIPWPNPFCFLPHVKPNSHFLYYLKYGTLQYTILQPIICLVAVVLNVFGLYEDGIIRADRGFVWCALLQNLSQILALYTLVWLYVILKNELAPFKPMPKFLIVKAVVFFTFWQGITIAWLTHIGVITATVDFAAGEVQVGLQDFLVCFEMLVAAMCHKYTFGYETYKSGLMKLLMDQRAFYLAQKSYQRAVAQARFRENEARIEAGLPPLADEVDIRTIVPTGDAPNANAFGEPTSSNGRAEAPSSEMVHLVEDVTHGGHAGAPLSPAQIHAENNLRHVLQRGTTVADVHAATIAEQMQRAGWDADQEEEGDALFDDESHVESSPRSALSISSVIIGGSGASRSKRWGRVAALSKGRAAFAASASPPATRKQHVSSASASASLSDLQRGSSLTLLEPQHARRSSQTLSLTLGAPSSRRMTSPQSAAPLFSHAVSAAVVKSRHSHSHLDLARATSASSVTAAADVDAGMDSDPYPSEHEYHDSDIGETQHHFPRRKGHDSDED